MYPILKLINLYFLLNNQYIAPYIFIHIFSTFLLGSSPLQELLQPSLNTNLSLWARVIY
jgi:hypothetical protein